MMSTERLKTLHRQEQTKRKFMCVMNDVAKTRQDLYTGYIEKEKQELEQKSTKSIVVTRRNVVRQRVLKQCMKNKRDEVEKENSKKLYGRYNGVTVEQIAEEIDPFIQKNHPKNRRQKKIDSLFREGFSKGAILDDDTMQNKVLDYFERPLVAIHHFEDPTNATKPDNIFPSVQKGFYTGDVQTASKSHMREVLNNKQRELSDFSNYEEDEKDKVFVRRKVSKFLKDDVPDDLSELSDAPPSDSVTKRGIRPVTLPPIKIGTDSEEGSQYYQRPTKKKDCITDLISRIHDAKDNRLREMKIKKERRTKRLQHERVFGIGSHTPSESSRGDLYTSQTDRPVSEFVTKATLNEPQRDRQRPVSEFVAKSHMNVVHAEKKHKNLGTPNRKMSNNGLRLPPIQR